MTNILRTPTHVCRQSKVFPSAYKLDFFQRWRWIFSIWIVEQFSKFSWWVWVRHFGMSSSCTRDNKSDRVPRTDQSTAPAPVLRDHLFKNQQLNCCSRVTTSRIRYGQLGQIWRHYCNFLLKCSLFNLEQIDTGISRPTSWDEACDWQCLDNKS